MADTDTYAFLSAPVNALLEGIYTANTTLEELTRHGDFGLGTFNHLDGEMLLLDGRIFQVRADGKTEEITDMSTQTPFACVMRFMPETMELLDESLAHEPFFELLARLIPSDNMLYALRLDGEFSYVKTRSVPRQENYRPLVEVAREQPEFEFNNIKGTLVGFHTPHYLQGVSVPGLHLHFISDDRTCGGHVLDCRLEHALVGVRHASQLVLGLPMTLDFMTTDFTRDSASDLEEAER